MVESDTCSGENQVTFLDQNSELYHTHFQFSSLKLDVHHLFPSANFLMHWRYLGGKSQRQSNFFFLIFEESWLLLLFERHFIFFLRALALDSGKKVLSPIVFNQRQKEKCPGAKSCLYSTRNFMNLKIHVTE